MDSIVAFHPVASGSNFYVTEVNEVQSDVNKTQEGGTHPG